MPTVQLLTIVTVWVRQRAAAARRDQRGEIVTTVITIAALALLAITACAIIFAKVTARANSIPTQ